MSDNDEQDRLTGSYSKVIQSNLDPPEMQYDLDRGWDTIPNIVTDQSCSHCLDTGWHCWTLQDVDHNIITFEWDQACRRCAALEKTCELLPPMYRQIEYDGQKKPFEYDRLKPFPGIPVPIDRQQKLLDQIQSGELDGHSILYSGPSRTGKSVMASAILGRTVERYLNAGFEEKWRGRRLPIYRINTDQWLGEHMAWDLHQWSSEQPRPDPPMLNRNTVCKLIPNDYVFRPRPAQVAGLS